MLASAATACAGSTGCASRTTSTASSARTPGAMADYMVFPAEALVYKVSKSLPAAHAAFAEPLSCALHAVERADIHFDDVVVVAGRRSHRARHGRGGGGEERPQHVVALDLADDKLELAKLCGADITVNVATRRPGRGGAVRSPTATAPMSTSRAPDTPPRWGRGYTLLRKLRDLRRVRRLRVWT